MKYKKALIALLVLVSAVLISFVTYTHFYSSSNTFNITVKTISRNRYIDAYGTVAIVSLQVYWDADATNVMTELNWGTLEPGGQYNQTAYIKNEGNIPINVSFCSTDWVPEEASTYIVFGCGTEYNIVPNEVRQVAFVLNVDSNIQNISNFDFTIIIVGEG